MSGKKVFAERLKAKRREKQMSQNQLAKVIHVASSAISNYERGVGLPDICIAERMSRFFGVPIGWLIGAEENFSDKSNTEDFFLAINSVINNLTLVEDGGNIAILIAKNTLLGEYLKNVNFLRKQGQAISDTLKNSIVELNQKIYQKYSVEELLKENTSQHEQP